MGRRGGARFSVVEVAAGIVKGILALAAVTALATGCEASIGTTKAVDKAEVERAAATQIAAKANLPKPTITCPDDQDAEVGATLECLLVALGDTAKLPVHEGSSLVRQSRRDRSRSANCMATDRAQTTAIARSQRCL